MAPKIFISYRRDDSAGHAGRVYDRLQRVFGRDLLFMDVDSIPLGTNFVEVLVEEITKCDALLAIIGPGWLDARDEKDQRRLEIPDDFVRIEIGTALKRGIRVIPVLLEGTHVPKADQLPDDLKGLALRNGLDVRHASFSEDMERLIHGLKGTQSGQYPAPVAPSLADSNSAPSPRHSFVRKFLNNDKNRAVLGLICGAVVVVISALWAAFVYFVPASKSVTPPAIEASGGGVAVGGNVTGSTINAGGATNAGSPKSK
jgi:TIR domain